MKKLGQIYTVGIWIVKKGKEKEFIQEWENFALWSKKNVSGSGSPILVQDLENPQKFVSLGPWESLEAIRKWRSRAEFKAFVKKVKILCEDFHPHTLKQVTN